MILVFDMTNTGTGHVPINRGLLQAMSLAFPRQQIRMHADADHLAALRDDRAIERLLNVEFKPIALSPLYRWKTHVVSARRFLHEWRVLRAALAAAPVRQPHLIVLASATPTAIAAAVMAAAAAPMPVAVQVGLHGNLNEVIGWRPRNPVARRFDLRSMLSLPNPMLRFLVFEDCIRDALAMILPETALRTDVLPHPVDGREAAGHPAPGLGVPLRVGLVGMATEAKGLTAFLDTARLFRQRYGDAIEFHIIGGRPHTTPRERFADIAHEVEIGHISREKFVAGLARLHYVFLPLQPGYYSLSPSGGLMDAVAWGKPVIASRVPITESLFRQGEDIGHLCDDLEGMQAALHAVMAGMDTARYGQQTAALARLRDGRGPEALSRIWRGIVTRGFPKLVPATPAAPRYFAPL
ncbi:glycosyltransferase involved in cell wall biosynthesis [Humitalea rosea]|uniref:Glycosyltransferase involved in cell wall biosynthesis n=1 Tax=Humitalea rosea TaxID=990373 RepID=A0A2W7ILZ2_9PROT|nr:glycosyltransferase [Humitalea rosea]PZW46781.1 glycosyltransferase involved in cell wall biosynthesis [Humitalea rosea]